MRKHAAAVLGMNVSTAVAWTCYFLALTHLEPAVVITLHSGMAPLTVIGLAVLGVPLAQREAVGPLEYGCYMGIALSLAGLWWVVLSGRSGLEIASLTTRLGGLALLMVSGAAITISLLYAKRLHDHGMHAGAVTAVRFLGVIVLAAGVLGIRGRWPGIGDVGATATAQIIRSLGPVCVFALEQLDRRLTYSAPVLACIVVYSAFVVAANVAHGWRGRSPEGSPRTS